MISTNLSPELLLFRVIKRMEREMFQTLILSPCMNLNIPHPLGELFSYWHITKLLSLFVWSLVIIPC